MPTVNFNILSGVSPFKARLIGSEIPENTFYGIGNHSIFNVPNGIYTLRIEDANECIFEYEVIVNPFVTTTTTTILPGDSIIVGNTQDSLTIFNQNATNRNSRYSGYPDPNITELYLWLRTADGKPLTTVKSIDYEINSSGGTAGSLFKFNSVSDEVHVEVQEGSFDTTAPLTGTLILKENFIESYFLYTYNKDEINPNFEINLTSSIEMFDTEVLTRFDEGKNYGITYVDRYQVNFNY